MAVFTEALHLELESTGSKVAVQALCPGFTYSEFHDVAGLDRKALAAAAYWTTAEDVVEASLQGLRHGKLYVIPGWRYRVMTALLTKLPTRLRLAVEMRASKARGKAVAAAKAAGA